MIKVTCNDLPQGTDFTDERETMLVRNRWLDRHVGRGNWKSTLEWNAMRNCWTHHYDLDCSASMAALFKLTWA